MMFLVKFQDTAFYNVGFVGASGICSYCSITFLPYDLAHSYQFGFLCQLGRDGVILLNFKIRPHSGYFVL